MTRTLHLIAMAATAALTVSASAEVPFAGVTPDEFTVLLWHFDEGEGSAVRDSSGTAGFDGTISGVQWIDGRFGKALQWGEEEPVGPGSPDLPATQQTG